VTAKPSQAPFVLKFGLSQDADRVLATTPAQRLLVAPAPLL
jgi:hypothetical protein